MIRDAIEGGQSLTDGHGDRDVFERAVALTHAEKIEPERGDALFRQEAGERRIGRTVLVRKEPVAQHGDAVGRLLGGRENRGDLVAASVGKSDRLFHARHSTRHGAGLSD